MESREKLQKGILVCILFHLIAFIGQCTLPVQLRVLAAIGAALLGIVGAVLVIVLALKTFGTGLGILLGVLSLAPPVGLIIMLIVNGRVINILRQNGIKVGLMGADISSI